MSKGFTKFALEKLRCPSGGLPLHVDSASGELVSSDGRHRYRVSPDGIPLMAEQLCSADGLTQQGHYDRIAAAYSKNLTYPHTQEYLAYIDRTLLGEIGSKPLGCVAEVCCGAGDALYLLEGRIEQAIGVDISTGMLRRAKERHNNPNFVFVQGDATMLPLADASFDSVFMLGGVHHVRDRVRLFSEISRILKPGGHYYYREPLNDFWLWRWLRAAIYRASPMLDAETEKPLRRGETLPVLEQTGLHPVSWRGFGFLGFCFFMNSDVLVFNRLFQFVPGIRAIVRGATRFDDWVLSLPGFRDCGLLVIGVAKKSAQTPQG